MKIGVDFDNTIVCYDPIFEAMIRERGIPREEGSAKSRLRNFLRKTPGGEVEWTRIQGEVYGRRIMEARPFEGALEFFRFLFERNIPVCVVSHKTRYPVLGTPCDLHNWAFRWLEHFGLFSDPHIALKREECFFELTKKAKLCRIASEGCTHFIDDLPEFLEEPSFPGEAKRILFVPSESIRTSSVWIHARSWNEVIRQTERDCQSDIRDVQALPRVISAGAAPEGNDDEKKFASLLKKNTGRELAAMERVWGGANNRGFSLRTVDGKKYFGKIYYRSPFDSRDRLGVEYGFLSFAALKGIESCPRPIGMDEGEGAAIYEFIDGKLPEPGQILESHWKQCFDFLLSLQSHRHAVEARKLPRGSETAFCLNDHLSFLRQRRDDWLLLVQEKGAHDNLRRLVLEDFEPAYQQIAEETIGTAGFQTEIPEEARILSPSDFGMHNALLKKDGKLVFIDFEYAGWDDPAKTVADFFCQPKMPAPAPLKEKLVRALDSVLSGPHRAAFHDRLPIVERCIGLKWCYILLNDFHPRFSGRRQFSKGAAAPGEIPPDRLAKIRGRLAAIKAAGGSEI
ncbi:MAG: phosphotransferase [Verrucomicrobiae bacterium]|nr:phosphotransferase [Verrucomicrobiae bacterium]